MARVKYSADQRAKVIQFIRGYDAKNKRGGIAQAQRKFKVAYPTLKAWLGANGKAAGKPAAKASTKSSKSAAIKKPTGPAAKAVKASATPQMRSEVMSRFEKVLDYERQIAALREAVEKEKAAIRNMLS